MYDKLTRLIWPRQRLRDAEARAERAETVAMTALAEVAKAESKMQPIVLALGAVLARVAHECRHDARNSKDALDKMLLMSDVYVEHNEANPSEGEAQRFMADRIREFAEAALRQIEI